MPEVRYLSETGILQEIFVYKGSKMKLDFAQFLKDFQSGYHQQYSRAYFKDIFINLEEVVSPRLSQKPEERCSNTHHRGKTIFFGQYIILNISPKKIP